MKELKDNFFISLGTVDHNFAPMYCSLCLPDCFVTECRIPCSEGFPVFSSLCLLR